MASRESGSGTERAATDMIKGDAVGGLVGLVVYGPTGRVKKGVDGRKKGRRNSEKEKKGEPTQLGCFCQDYVETQTLKPRVITMDLETITSAIRQNKQVVYDLFLLTMINIIIQ